MRRLSMKVFLKRAGIEKLTVNKDGCIINSKPTTSKDGSTMHLTVKQPGPVPAKDMQTPPPSSSSVLIPVS